MDRILVLSLGLLTAHLAVHARSLGADEAAPPQAEKFDFHVDFVADTWRTVRVFWNSGPRRYSAETMLARVFEEDRLVAEHSLPRHSQMRVFNVSLRAHTLRLRSKRHPESSADSGVLTVPAQSAVLALPGYVATRVGDEFHYRWTMPAAPVTGVTMIWCNHMDTKLRTCGRSILEHVRLPANQTQVRRKFADGQYRAMALRVDAADSSTGVLLPQCECAPSEVASLVDVPTVRAYETYLAVDWPMRCAEEAVVYGVSGYNVRYCPAQEGRCLTERELEIAVESAEPTLRATIENLAPGTGYKISATVRLRDGRESGRREYVAYTAMPDANMSMEDN